MQVNAAADVKGHAVVGIYRQGTGAIVEGFFKFFFHRKGHGAVLEILRLWIGKIDRFCKIPHGLIDFVHAVENRSPVAVRIGMRRIEQQHFVIVDKRARKIVLRFQGKCKVKMRGRIARIVFQRDFKLFDGFRNFMKYVENNTGVGVDLVVRRIEFHGLE